MTADWARLLEPLHDLAFRPGIVYLRRRRSKAGAQSRPVGRADGLPGLNPRRPSGNLDRDQVVVIEDDV